MKPSKNTKTGKKTTRKDQLLSPDLLPTATPVASASLSTESSDVELSNAEQKRIQDMIAIAQLEYAKIKTNIVKEKKKEIDSLNSTLKEFIGPFMLIGYDLNNNPIEMVSASSAAEHDALLERLRRVMYKINQNIMNSGGTDPYGLNNN